MKVKFWGVRGSLPVPGLSTSHFGGNTACIELTGNKHRLILDAGTGLREFGKHFAATKNTSKTFHLLLSHCHLDHLIGLPFFTPLYSKKTNLHLYGPSGKKRSLKDIVSRFLAPEIFPLLLDHFPGTFHFHPLSRQPLIIESFEIYFFTLNHPGKTLGYRIHHQNKRLAYVTDHEPVQSYRHLPKMNPKKYSKELILFLKNVDLLIHDAHFADAHYPKYRGWGHSPWSHAMEVAELATVKQLVLFHHAPDATDEMLKKQLGQLLKKPEIKKTNLKIWLAREKMTIEI